MRRGGLLAEASPAVLLNFLQFTRELDLLRFEMCHKVIFWAAGRVTATTQVTNAPSSKTGHFRTGP